MKVKELVKRLSKLDQDAIVVLSIDQEGNGFGLLDDIVGSQNYRDGEIGFAKLTPQLEMQGYSDDDVMHGGKPCVVLWP